MAFNSHTIGLSEKLPQERRSYKLLVCSPMMLITYTFNNGEFSEVVQMGGDGLPTVSRVGL